MTPRLALSSIPLVAAKKKKNKMKQHNELDAFSDKQFWVFKRYIHNEYDVSKRLPHENTSTLSMNRYSCMMKFAFCQMSRLHWIELVAVFQSPWPINEILYVTWQNCISSIQWKLIQFEVMILTYLKRVFDRSISIQLIATMKLIGWAIR